ncbi:MAG: TRAP transporter small permease [Rhodobacterales bacterium]|nr:TRAP transporter small permease [Rhodobacterales bacterium]
MNAILHLSDRAIVVVARLLGGLAAVLLFCMMTLTFVDVIGRYFFSLPVPGGFEMTELMMATLIFAGLPLVTVYDEHIVVDLFDFIVPHRARAFRDAAVTLVCALAMGVISNELAIKATEEVDYGDVTAVLLIPMAPFTYFMSVMTGFTCLLLVVYGLALAVRRPLARGEHFDQS